jgi:tetratricopeptide (TPR) repeat protein
MKMPEKCIVMFIELLILIGCSPKLNTLVDTVREIDTGTKIKEAEVYYNKGIEYSRQENYENAIAEFTKALELDPKYIDAYKGRGAVYKVLREGYIFYNETEENKNYIKAENDYTQAIQLNPNDWNLYNERVALYYGYRSTLICPEKAIADYTKMIELKPNDAYAYFWRAKTNLSIIRYEDLSENDYNKIIDRIIVDCDKAITIIPDYIDAFEIRSFAYLYKGDLKKARAEYEYIERMEIDPNVISYYTRNFLIELEAAEEFAYTR